MKIKEIITKIYVVGDREFTDREEAERYELELQKEVERQLSYVYYMVDYAPEPLKEYGYLYTNKMTIAVKKEDAESEYAIVLQYCLDNIGAPLKIIEDSKSMANFVIRERKEFKVISDLTFFKNEGVNIGSFLEQEQYIRTIIYVDSCAKEISREGGERKSEELSKMRKAEEIIEDYRRRNEELKENTKQ